MNVNLLDPEFYVDPFEAYWELVDPEEPRIMPATFARAYDRVRIRFTPS